MSMAREEEFAEIVARCKKIMGPVAESLAEEAAKEAGARIEAGKIFIASEGQFASMLSKYREKLAKIVGKPLAENLVK